MVDSYSGPKLRQLIGPQCQISLFKQVSSTQSIAKAVLLKNDVDRPWVFIADEQTRGYGQFGRHFYSPAGTGIYFSLAIPLRVRKRGLFTTGLAATIAQVLDRWYPARKIKLKWVNDLYIGAKKVGGILVEQVQGTVICGVGLNITTREFPAELDGKAAAISYTGSPVDRNQVVATLVNQIITDAPNYQEGKFLPSYRQRSLLVGRQVAVNVHGKVVRGMVKTIDEQGALVINPPQGKEIALVSGKVVKVDLD